MTFPVSIQRSHRRRQARALRAWPLAALAAACIAPAAVAQRAAAVQDVDEPGRNPFSLSGPGLATSPNYVRFDVPAGKRFVVQTYSVVCSMRSGIYLLPSVVFFGSTAGNQVSLTTTGHYVHAPNTPYNAFRATGYGPLYAEPGTTISILVEGESADPGVNTCTFNVAGYAIGVP